MILYGYRFFVIDHYWEFLPSVDQFFKNLVDLYPPQENIEEFQLAFSSATTKWKYAQKLADKLGWEGDFVGEPRVFFLPDPQNMMINFGFVFKQRNNGMTFVISPIHLDYIADLEEAEWDRIIIEE
ncbi:hypothetical protein VXQ08_08235 [Acinetobacter towneri]|uniref:hypothetical protein n=1 Tax=Acinetobacter towneri TaxID=202956 RepID=UPI001CE0E12D|nr:hypothetical protein [Acinetobacter towneri]MCA4817372.1 hypothetical protein [Acinetobacter towneri]